MENSTITSLACITAYNVAFHPVYRIAQFYQVGILILAIFPLFYFIFFKLTKSSFHGNLKWILTGYFASTLCFTLVMLSHGTIHVIIPFFVVDKCDVIIDKTWIKYGNPMGSLLMTMPTFFPICITIERFLATKMAKDYEKIPVLLGPILTFLVVFIDCFIVALIYKDEPFSEGAISFVAFPATTAPKMYAFFYMMFFLNLINFIFNFVLLKQNVRLKKENSTLAARYQLEEVYLSTRFSISVIFVHVIFFGFYVCVIMFSRYFGAYLIPNPVNLGAARGAMMTLIATYNFVIGTVAVYLYKRIRSKKSQEITGNIQMKATGNDGARNYDDAMFSIWNSHSSNNRVTVT